MDLLMNIKLRELNQVTDNILKELELDMRTNTNPDVKAYLEVNEIIY
jgi:hypothetical protein